MVPYVDYHYYAEEYKGDAIPQIAFEQLARDASVFVREITFDRIPEEIILDAVKDAVCAVCEVMYTEEQQVSQSGGREIKAENTDGYSVTYVTETQDGQSREEVLRRKMYQAAKEYLLFTGLLYQGVR